MTIDFQTILMYIFVIVLSFICVYLATPFIIKIASYVGANKSIESEEHYRPKMGGLAIYTGFIMCYMVFGKEDISMIGTLIGSFLILIVGVIEDITPLQNKYKYAFQIATAMIVVYYGDFVISDIYLWFNIYFDFASLGYLVTIIWLLLLINSIKLIDDIEGVADGVGIIYFLTALLITLFSSYSAHEQAANSALFSAIMFGGTLGFYRYNKVLRKITLGNTGTLFMGYMIAVISLEGLKKASFISLIIPVLIILLPFVKSIIRSISSFINNNKFLPIRLGYFYERSKVERSLVMNEIFIITILLSVVAFSYSVFNDLVTIIISLIVLGIIFMMLKKYVLTFNYYYQKVIQIFKSNKIVPQKIKTKILEKVGN